MKSNAFSLKFILDLCRKYVLLKHKDTFLLLKDVLYQRAMVFGGKNPVLENQFLPH